MADVTFKEQIAKDVSTVFINHQEFADVHNVNGTDMWCMFDNNEMIDREKRYQHNSSDYAGGIFLKQLLLYVKADDFGALPNIGRTILVDSKKYLVCDAIDEDGIYSLTVEATKTI